jgi:hypothetical protein
VLPETKGEPMSDDRVTVTKDGLDWVSECKAHDWFVYSSDHPLAYELAAGHVCMQHPKVDA